MSEISYKVLIAVTGSVAAIKAHSLVESIMNINTADEGYRFEEPCIVVTEHAKHFLRSFKPLLNLYEDSKEWESWNERGDPIVHIDLGKWADMMVIAPLDANTLAKISQGICDNLLTCTVRAWDLTKPLLFCPAMNTRMWEHPVTSKQINTLKEWGYEEIPPISKTLVCGDAGLGAMAEIETIINRIKSLADEKFQKNIVIH